MSAHERFWFEVQQAELVAYLDDLLAPAKPELADGQPLEGQAVVETAFVAETVVSAPSPLLSLQGVASKQTDTPDTVLQIPVHRSLILAEQRELMYLYIECNDRRYALPLIQLGRIFRAEQHLTPLAGQPAWQLGILPTDPILQAVDLHHVLSGEAGQSPAYFVSVADSRRVLSCQAIQNSERVEQGAILWRTDRKRSPLVAGIIRDHLTPVLDLSRLDECLV